jgi:hypothetical protein
MYPRLATAYISCGVSRSGRDYNCLIITPHLLGEEWGRDTIGLNASDERGIKAVRVRVVILSYFVYGKWSMYASIEQKSLKFDVGLGNLGR